jgi:hypothetical protein
MNVVILSVLLIIRRKNKKITISRKYFSNKPVVASPKWRSLHEHPLFLALLLWRRVGMRPNKKPPKFERLIYILFMGVVAVVVVAEV